MAKLTYMICVVFTMSRQHTPYGVALSGVQKTPDIYTCNDMYCMYNAHTIYSFQYVGGWELVTHFDVASYDLSEIAWSIDGRAICIRDTYLEYRLLFYAPTDGAPLHMIQVLYICCIM